MTASTSVDGDQLLSGRVGFRPDPRRDLFRLFRVDVADRDDARAGQTVVRRRMWSWPIMPTPITPICRVI